MCKAYAAELGVKAGFVFLITNVLFCEKVWRNFFLVAFQWKLKVRVKYVHFVCICAMCVCTCRCLRLCMRVHCFTVNITQVSLSISRYPGAIKSDHVSRYRLTVAQNSTSHQQKFLGLASTLADPCAGHPCPTWAWGPFCPPGIFVGVAVLCILTPSLLLTICFISATTFQETRIQVVLSKRHRSCSPFLDSEGVKPDTVVYWSVKYRGWPVYTCGVTVEIWRNFIHHNNKPVLPNPTTMSYCLYFLKDVTCTFISQGKRERFNKCNRNISTMHGLYRENAQI